jgi:transposase-like protein
MFCPKCHSGQIIKSGFVSNKQRYKCCACNYHFTRNSKGVKADQKRIAFHLYLEGYSMREISRILGISDVAVGKWIRPVKSHLVPLRKRKVKKVELHRIEHFLLSKAMFQHFGWLLIGMEENKDICLLGSQETGNCRIIEIKN